jgi:hypothetical protein
VDEVQEPSGGVAAGYYVGGLEDDNKIDEDTQRVISYVIHSNMSIAQTSPWVSFITNLIPTLLLLGVMF